MQIARNWAKAGAKVLLFSELPKLFQEKFKFSSVLFPLLDKSQAKDRLYIIIYNKINDFLASYQCLGIHRNNSRHPPYCWQFYVQA